MDGWGQWRVDEVGKTGQDTPHEGGVRIQRVEAYRGRMNNMKRAKKEKAEEGSRLVCRESRRERVPIYGAEKRDAPTCPAHSRNG